MFIDTNNTGITLGTQNSSNIYNQESNNYKTTNDENQETNSFNTALADEQKKYVKEDTRTDKEIIEDMKKLAEDIISKIKTGMTEEEIEALEEALRKINEEMKKENYDKKEVEKMMQNLERAIAYYKKKITGEAIIEAESLGKKDNSKTSENVATTAGDISSRIEMAEKDISELKKGIKEVVPKQVYNQSELLEIIKKFQNK